MLMYDPIREPAMMIAYLGVLVKLCSSFPLLTMASRNAIYYIVGWDVDTLPFWKHCIVVVSLAVCSLLCGLFIPNINTVFGFVGAICGGTLAFLFPAVFMMYGGNWSLKSVGFGHYVLTYTLMMTGVVVIVFGTASTIYGAVVGDK
ncbi:putative amino acid transporter PAT1 [Trypanosoma theileri]|uniref:Putative amino acid transporter PAT1 n=1 Tax=Trypanosoma theileri TaxID=67003 RepID=A0A1X0NQH1_9TRYP|nr:putative amino acid transporter PAT1 [Trypanosoma theileri]ORC86758.1 putative amino acid transporter PAT1 [Trypanosoma theileri]